MKIDHHCDLSPNQKGAGLLFVKLSVKLNIILGLCLAVLAACAPSKTALEPTAEDIATGYMIPTEVSISGAVTELPTSTLLLADTIIPTAADITATATVQVVTAIPVETSIPWPTNTFQPSIMPVPTLNFKPPLPAILIDTPGQLSKIGTPIILRSDAMPGDDGIVYISVVDEYEKEIYSRNINLSDSLYKHTYLKTQIDFSVQAAAETARISMFTKDYYGRLQSLASVDVILMQMGEDLITPASISQEPYIIQQPLNGQIITGGKLRVKGYFRPVNHSPLTLTLVDQKGSTLLEQTFPVSLIDSQQPYQAFSLEVNYSISAETRVRLQVFQRSDNRLPGIIALNSLELVLRP